MISIPSLEAPVHAAALPRSWLRSAAVPLCLMIALGCAPARRAPVVAAAPPPEPPPPVGQLPRDVKPLSYTLELEIVPSRDGFSGRTQIRVELAKPSRHVWLHARRLQVKSARAQLASAAVDARFRQ